VRPQLAVLVDLDSLQAGLGGLGGVIDTGALDAEGCRRLACDGAVTRVLVTRQPTNHHAHGPTGPDAHLDHLSGHHHHDPGGLDPGGHEPGGHAPAGHRGHHHPGGDGTLAAQLRAAARRLPPMLGEAPTQPLEVGRTTRVVQPGQRLALAVRDGGCVVPGCDRPLAWCEAHHLCHWVDGGRPTWTTWCWCAGPITGRSMRGAGD
jgi:hypothetical protein